MMDISVKTANANYSIVKRWILFMYIPKEIDHSTLEPEILGMKFSDERI